MQNTTDLIGTWLIDETDKPAVNIFGGVTLDFDLDGVLLYTIREGEKLQIINMTYTVEDGIIVTNQPSAPSFERTKFTISPNGILTLYFDGMTSRFKREDAFDA